MAEAKIERIIFRPVVAGDGWGKTALRVSVFTEADNPLAAPTSHLQAVEFPQNGPPSVSRPHAVDLEHGRLQGMLASRPEEFGNGDGVLATCITGYDEEFPELQHTFGTILPQKKEGREFDKLAYMFGDLTVEKLEKQRKHWKGQSGMEDVKSTYCIVMDGILALHPTMKEYLEVLMSPRPVQQDGAAVPSFFEYLEALMSPRPEQQDGEGTESIFSDVLSDWFSQNEFDCEAVKNFTYVVEFVQIPEDGDWGPQEVRRSNEPREQAPVPHGPLKGEYVTLIIKAANRRKANSHRWFFDCFAREMEPELVFCTDLGTGFEEDCISQLYEYMKTNEKCVGATGRQVVMTSSMQAQDDGLSEKALRLWQRGDYDSGFAMAMGAFSLVGFVPVLPGPCQMLRFKSNRFNTGMTTDVLPKYFEIVETPVEQTGTTLGNAKLAEDRILSFLVVLKSRIPGAYSTWVLGAEFYYQAETSMRGLLLQRRRWLNGTFHCLLYLTTVSPHLMNESLVFAPENTAIENSVNRGEGEEIQPLQQRTNCCRHALSCKYYKTKIGFLLTWLLYLVQVVNFVVIRLSPSIVLIGLHFALPHLFGDAIVRNVLFWVNALLWVLFPLSHSFHSDVGIFNPLVFGLFAISNFSAMIMIVVSFVLQYTVLGQPLDVMFWSVVGIVALPVVMALLSSPIRSFPRLVFGSYLIYLLLTPTFVGGFLLYADARLWDLRWGNRATTEESAHRGATHEDAVKLRSRLRWDSITILIFLFLLNLTCVILVINLGLHDTFLWVVISILFGVQAIEVSFAVPFCIWNGILYLWKKLVKKCRRCCSARRTEEGQGQEEPTNARCQNVGSTSGEEDRFLGGYQNARSSS